MAHSHSHAHGHDDHDHGSSGVGNSHHHDTDQYTSTNNTMTNDLEPINKDALFASNIGDFTLLKKFIEEENVDVNTKGEDDLTCLHWAAYKNHVEIVKYLIQKGAIVDAVTKKEGHTPLMWACISGCIKVVFILLKNGADMHKVDHRGYNVVHHAVQYNQNVVAHYLIEKGIPVEARDNDGHTALLWAAYTNHEDSVRYLLSKGSSINSTDNGGCTALHWAAAKGNLQVVKALLQVTNIDVAARDKEGLTPAQGAERKLHFKVAKLLKEAERIRVVGNNSTSTQPKNLNEKQLQLLWFFVAFMGIQYFFFVMTNFPSFLLGLIIVIGTMYFLKYLLGHMWLDLNHRNPTWVGVVASAYSLSVYAYWTNIYYVANVGSLEIAFFVVMNFVYVYLYIKLVFGDPGFIRKQSASRNEWKEYLISLEHDEPLPQFCLSCMVRKPLRAKHCRSCNECVVRFDHHCGWINNCVGAKNHVPFLIDLILVILNHIFFIRVCSLALGSIHDAPNFFPINKSIGYYYETEPLIVLLIFFHSVNVFWQAWLLYSLLQGVRKNETTNEVLNGSRYDYLKDPETKQFKNPFNRGLVNNIKDLVSPDINWYRLYHLPKYYSV